VDRRRAPAVRRRSRRGRGGASRSGDSSLQGGTGSGDAFTPPRGWQGALNRPSADLIGSSQLRNHGRLSPRPGPLPCARPAPWRSAPPPSPPPRSSRRAPSAPPPPSRPACWPTSPTARSTTRSGSSLPPSIVVLDGIAYFSHDDGVTGHELWRSDGTEAGTWRVRHLPRAVLGKRAGDHRRRRSVVLLRRRRRSRPRAVAERRNRRGHADRGRHGTGAVQLPAGVDHRLRRPRLLLCRRRRARPRALGQRRQRRRYPPAPRPPHRGRGLPAERRPGGRRRGALLRRRWRNRSRTLVHGRHDGGHHPPPRHPTRSRSFRRRGATGPALSVGRRVRRPSLVRRRRRHPRPRAVVERRVRGGHPDGRRPEPGACRQRPNGTDSHLLAAVLSGRKPNCRRGAVLDRWDVHRNRGRPPAWTGFFLPVAHRAVFRGHRLHRRRRNARQEIWKSDGTAGGTVLVADLEPGPDGGAHAAWAWPALAVGDQLFSAPAPMSSRRSFGGPMEPPPERSS
jgi:ELWxxDGT repeat protein